MAVFAVAILLLAELPQLPYGFRSLASDERVSSSQEGDDKWKTLYCNMHKVKKDCSKLVAEREGKCGPLRAKKDSQTLTQVQKIKAQKEYESSGCKAFDEDKASCIKQAKAPPPGQKIKEVAKACERQAERICRESSCPTFCALKKMAVKQCKCQSMCSAQVWATGTMNCEPNDSWEKCVQKHNKKLEGAGRHPALEALTREHLVKCVCVSRQTDTSVCYTGTMALKRGQKWCEWNDAPSWQKLLKSGDRGNLKGDWTRKPSCSEKVSIGGGNALPWIGVAGGAAVLGGGGALAWWKTRGSSEF